MAANVRFHMPSESSANWGLDERALGQLLVRLDADRGRAGEKYEQLRRGLVRIFDWRGVLAPDMCADETIDRVARKLNAGTAIDDVVAFAYGVARLVVLEQSRRPEARQVSLDEAVGVADLSQRESDASPRLTCLGRCLDELDTEARTLVLGYYAHARRQRIDARAALAHELGLTQNALRSRVQRIRNRLELCTNACAAAKDDGAP